MVGNLVRNARARIAQFAAAHRWSYGLAAVAFAALVGWEVYSLSSIDGAGPVESVSQPISTRLSETERTVTIPHTFAAPPVLAGDPVDVAIWIDPVMGATEARLIGPAKVIDIDTQATSVAVSSIDVIDIVEALSVGSVMVVPRATG